MRSVCASSAGRSRPRRAASCSRPSSTPSDGSSGVEDEAVAVADHQARFLGLDRAGFLVAGIEHVAVRLPVLAAEDAAGAVFDAVAGGVADRRFFGLDDHLDDAAGAAAILSVAARIGAELVRLEEQREPHLGHFEAAELDAAGGLPLAAAGPAIARGRGAAARPRLEEMPDERSASGDFRARVPALDRKTE